MHPACQGDGLPGMGATQFPASMCFIHRSPPEDLPQQMQEIEHDGHMCACGTVQAKYTKEKHNKESKSLPL
jgi:hypothetical protein